MNKTYIISTATAIALGYAAGFASDNLTAQAGFPVEKQAQVEKKLGTAAKTQWESFLVNQLCDQLESAFGVSAGSCTIDTFKQSGVMMLWDRQGDWEGWKAQANLKFNGTWVVGAPQ